MSRRKSKQNKNTKLDTSTIELQESKVTSWLKGKATLILSVILVASLPWVYSITKEALELEDDETPQSELREWTVNTVPNTRLTSNLIHVSDPDSIIDEAYEDSINLVLSQIRHKADVFVVALASIDNVSGDAFTYELFNHWGIGDADKNNGVLVLMTLKPHFVRIETGYGMEGILPDITCGKVISKVVVPQFKEEKYGQGLLDCSKALSALIAGPEYGDTTYIGRNILLDTEEQTTDEADESIGDSLMEIVSLFIELIGLIVLLWYTFTPFTSGILVFYHLSKLYTARSEYNEQKRTNRNAAYAATAEKLLSSQGSIWMCIIFPYAAVSGLIILILGYIFRYKARICPMCGKKMHRLSESEEDTHMSAFQTKEEALSVYDYDVWVCECGHEEIYKVEGLKFSSYEDCPKCKTHMLKLISTTTITEATYSKEGLKELSYVCKNCGYTKIEKKVIPRRTRSSGGTGGRHSGGSSGGSFGGGRSGGGGSSSSW